MRKSPDDPATVYPRTYRLRRWVAALWFVTGLLGIVWGGLCAVYFWQAPGFASENLRLLFVAICGLMIVYGIFCIASMFHYRFVLGRDKVEVHTFFRRYEMRRDNISGLVRTRHGPVEIITLIPNDPSVKRLKFTDYMQPDELFEQWLASIADLRRNP